MFAALPLDVRKAYGLPPLNSPLGLAPDEGVALRRRAAFRWREAATAHQAAEPWGAIVVLLMLGNVLNKLPVRDREDLTVTPQCNVFHFPK
jgi:hypothetical protein